MSMKNLILTVGLPRSGKSTWCSYRMKTTPVVSPDAIRMALGCYPFVQEREPEVWESARVMVASLFIAGHSLVIVDATNLRKVKRIWWSNALDVPDLKVSCVVFKSDKDECIRRALETKQDYLVPVIEMMSEGIDWPDPKKEDVRIPGRHGLWIQEILNSNFQDDLFAK